MHVAIIVFDGFEELDAIGPFEVFGRSARAVDDASVELVSVDGSRVAGANGLVVEASTAIDDHVDIVVIPGGGWTEDGPGIRTAVAAGNIQPLLREQYDDGAVLAGVCTGAMAIASIGLLGDRPAITHHGAIEDLAAAGARVTEARVVDAGDIVTSGGVTAGIDLALWIVERELGEEVATSVAEAIEYERRGRIVT